MSCVLSTYVSRFEDTALVHKAGSLALDWDQGLPKMAVALNLMGYLWDLQHWCWMLSYIYNIPKV